MRSAPHAPRSAPFARLFAGLAGGVVIATPAFAGAPVVLPQRLVQFASVDLDAGVVELRNQGAKPMALDGWRFCTHSSAQARRYTAAAALNGVTIAPGGSLFVHMNNDAPADPARFNASTLGNFASGFGQGPYTFQLFWPNGGSLSFGALDDMVDHVQWSVMGQNNAIAGTRSQQAVNAGLWNAANAWIVTTGQSDLITLDVIGAELNAPADYTVTEPPLNCNDADLVAPFGILDLGDINAFIGGFTSGDPIADIAPPAGVFDLGDINAFIGAFLSGCP